MFGDGVGKAKVPHELKARRGLNWRKDNERGKGSTPCFLKQTPEAMLAITGEAFGDLGAIIRRKL